ncbi:MAG: hypothetical protein K2X77_25240 [Candidatus Obscuribacterales bacterium]|jgi:hypothetical protein|nr:hypothetical protein [Candidatus Obscuribacterales bacterium]
MNEMDRKELRKALPKVRVLKNSLKLDIAGGVAGSAAPMTNNAQGDQSASPLAYTCHTGVMLC